MSAYIGAVSVTDKHGRDYRLQLRPGRITGDIGPWPGYRFAQLNGWHCGHWHRTAEDALACMIAKATLME